MWEATRRELDSATQYQVLQHDARLTFRALFRLLSKDVAFRRWYSQLLGDCEFAAFYWEHPSLTVDNLDDPAEFVLVDAPALARMRPDPTPFDDQFSGASDGDVLVFPNLGGDALLVVPRPIGPPASYAHLAAFVRHAPTAQIDALWQVMANAVRENLGQKPRWLSTAGLGVAWLHLRLDTRPKYYSFAPYK